MIVIMFIGIAIIIGKNRKQSWFLNIGEIIQNIYNQR